MKNNDYSRRRFINKCLSSCSFFLGGAVLLNSCNSNESADVKKKPGISEDPCNDLTGVSDEELKKRQSLGYVTKTPIPDNFCGNCSLYIPPTSEGGCGGCLLFKGPVYAEGHCVQYVAKE
jgi:hypothetical protein